jgi:hypothetical protein
MTTRPFGSVIAEWQRNGAFGPAYRAGSSIGTGHGTYRATPPVTAAPATAGVMATVIPTRTSRIRVVMAGMDDPERPLVPPLAQRRK